MKSLRKEIKVRIFNFAIFIALCSNFSIADDQVDCSKVNYQNMESPSVVLLEKKKASENKSVENLNEYHKLINKICAEAKCMMNSKRIDFKTFEKEYVDSIEWVKTPFQRTQHFNFIKELELETCVK